MQTTKAQIVQYMYVLVVKLVIVAEQAGFC